MRADEVVGLAYALKWSQPFRNDIPAVEWHHFPEMPDRKTRVWAFLDAYSSHSRRSTSPRPSPYEPKPLWSTCCRS